MLKPTWPRAGWSLIGVVLLGGLLVLRPAAAQHAGDTAMTELQAAFAEGDAPALLRHAATHVEIALFGASKLYSQGQALYVMQDFFGKHPPDKFVFRDYAHTKGGSFAEGDYWSRRSERPLRVYVRLRVQGDDWEVREVLIEERRR